MTLQLKLEEIGYDAQEPNACSIINCEEQLNGLWHMSIHIGELKTVMSLCEEHHTQIMNSIEDSSSKQKWLLEWSYEFNEDDPDAIVYRKEVFGTKDTLQARLKDLDDMFGGIGGVTAKFGWATQVLEPVWRFAKDNEVA